MASLTSERMKVGAGRGRVPFDWVIIDTPPVGLLPDAQLLARLADGVLVVIGAGRTPYTMVQRVVNELGADQVVGAVLNRVEDDVVPATGYYNDYYSSTDTPALGRAIWLPDADQRESNLASKVMHLMDFGSC